MPTDSVSEPPQFLYGTAWKEERTAALTSLALKVGFRGIDTANQRKHYFEAAVGDALKSVYSEGIVRRQDVFLQTKFTYLPGQDHRLPYDPKASLSTQVAQSLADSLEHLGTEWVDSYLLHGPATFHGWSSADQEVWAAMVQERDAGRARMIGVSNVSVRHLEQMAAAGADTPSFVQNRCYASRGWDRDVRLFCRKHKIAYQAFSLLTGNREVLRHPLVTGLASKFDATAAQLIFSFAHALGLLTLTGTSDEAHMKEDLAALRLKMNPNDVRTIEFLAS